MTSGGQHTNAIYGFASMLTNLLTSEKPTHVAAAFDVSRKTFRSERFPEYKANRASTPDEFRSQVSYLYELVSAFGIKHFAVEGFEADDVIATLAKAAEADGFEVLICTGDRDSFQLVNESTTVLYPKRGVTDLTRMTPDEVFSKYGLTPAQYPDFAALRGDPSDNLPSTPGVGEKTAAKWIVEYGSLEKLLASAQEIPGKVGESLRGNLDAIRLNHELTHLRSDMDLGNKTSDLVWDGILDSQLRGLLEKLEIKAMGERLKSLPGAAKDSGSNLKDIKSTSKSQTTNGAAVASKEVTPDELTKILVGHKSPIALDFYSADGVINEYSVALSESELYIVRSEVFGQWFTDSTIPKWVHGGKEIARKYPLKGIVFDTELAAYLINSGGRNLALSDLTERFLGTINDEIEESLFQSFDGLGAISRKILQ